ncbi:phenazine biosynthesis protein PhzF family [Chitinophaga costaii]|uniref:Phenazine biosynthesis protein PhzF family n=1 Tax=Chitinophaga costaii TaxID=1335309 RepID=A0A1C4CQZ6_9BACT|nr:PhzF family phenazine biosynthesis protein [Chitinophaga costaii]PUZ26991.1 PhzF family phenazine biosynthesis protein [Chitinophaga costaii]SCC21449.1 phenazine biosynthesis protein PhzF family [Chitinophaga costaii]
MQPFPIYQVDAFTSTPLRGNPAAVCLLTTPLPDITLQAIAAENNLAETAFLVPQAHGYHLRWFTPTAEVPLCGHATLASAHVLWETGRAALPDAIHFHTLSGTLLASRDADGAITLDFPVSPGKAVELPSAIQQAIPARIVHASSHGDRYVLELENAEAVETLQPDFTVIKATGGVVITARGKTGTPYDFISRFFASHIGIDEDPVTGSAHCCLAAYWAPLLGKKDFRAYQASARGGEMRVQLVGDRVLMTGNAVTVLKGEFVRYE